MTALTKRLSEDLSAYIQEAGLRGRYLHSEIQTLERVEILSDLRKGDFDVLIGVNENVANTDTDGIEHHLHPETLKKLNEFLNVLKSSHEFRTTQG